MTDKEWTTVMTEIESLRFQLTRNIMPLSQRQDLQRRLASRLIDLGTVIKAEGLTR
jgi:hypothetical protein